MRHLLLKLEPVIWLLFGQGIMIGTMLLTAYLAIVGLAIPLGIVPAEALSYDRALHLGASLIGRVVLFALIALPMWKGAHHVRHRGRCGARAGFEFQIHAGGQGRDRHRALRRRRNHHRGPEPRE